MRNAKAIVNIVAFAYGVTPEQIKGPSRKGRLPQARQMIIHVMLEKRFTQSLIATHINRNRSVVSNFRNRVTDDMKIYKATKNIYQQIITTLKNIEH